MPEMPNVIGGEVVSSDWGNKIRDRTIQRYATVAERTTEHGSPSPGDLSYLESSDGVYVWDGSTWVVVVPADGITNSKIGDSAVSTSKIADEAVSGPKLADNIMGSLMLVGSAYSEGPNGIGPTFTTLAGASIVLAIPADWESWACSVDGHTVITQTGDSTSAPTSRLVFEVVIDGTSNEFHSSHVGRQTFGGPFGAINSRLTVPLHGFRTGMTTTGNRTIALQRHRGSLDDVYLMNNTVLIARAHKLT